MTIKDQIIEFLKAHPEGIDDDLLAKKLNLSARQQANSRCRELEAQGLVKRKKVYGKIHNFWVGGVSKPEIVKPTVTDTMDKSRSWFWEGNIQAEVVRYLVELGYSIMSVADTASHQRGKDIIADKNGRDVWVSVKGYPKGTKKTHPSTQAGHWFKQAVFDILEYRGESKEAKLIIAIPDFPRYRKLAKKIDWLESVARFSYYWVKENGQISVE